MRKAIPDLSIAYEDESFCPICSMAHDEVSDEPCCDCVLAPSSSSDKHSE